MGKSEYQKVIDHKKKTKKELFEERWPKEDLRLPLVVIMAPKRSASNNMLSQLLEGCLVLPGKVIVISDEESPDLSKHPSGKISWMNPKNEDSKETIDKCLWAADIAVVFEEHLQEIKESMAKGIVLIGHEKSPLLENYHPNEETGNSFTYESTNPWSIFMALVRAHETFRFPYDWQHIVRGILKE